MTSVLTLNTSKTKKVFIAFLCLCLSAVMSARAAVSAVASNEPTKGRRKISFSDTLSPERGRPAFCSSVRSGTGAIGDRTGHCLVTG
jgi:hypothetical protein